MQPVEPADHALPQAGARSLLLVDNTSILTPTSGFLRTGYTHTINAYQGCAFAGSLCGTCSEKSGSWSAVMASTPWASGTDAGKKSG